MRSDPKNPPVQVLGLGSGLKTDDGAGLLVVRLLEKLLPPGRARLTLGGTAGPAVADLITCPGLLIVVDACVTGAAPGTIHEVGLEDLAGRMLHGPGAFHGLDLAGVLEEKRSLNPENAPARVRIFAIEAEDVETFSESCTQEVAKAAEELARRIAREIL